jgi:hypothetical protein
MSSRPEPEKRRSGLLSELTDDETPLGDTPEVHDEISPHDLPPDHPSRDETARQANRDRE